MRLPGRRYRDEWLPNFYPSRRVADDAWLRVSRTGKTVTLTADEDAQVDEVFMTEELFRRLERTGHIVTRANAARLFDELATWQSPTYAGPSLHIVVLTRRCNLNCTYCHMNPQPAGEARTANDLTPEVARHVARFALESPNPRLHFEFQGGEAFLNFGVMQAFVEDVRRRNREVGKQVSFSVVSNLTVARDEQLRFCHDNGITISFTLNGPDYVHDHYRRTRGGHGTQARVLERLEAITSRYPGLLTALPLCVVDSWSAPRLDEIVDFFYEREFAGVALIRLKHLGNAVHSGLTLDADAFCRYYIGGLDHILAKNRSGDRVFAERMVPLALAKALGDRDVGFVDWKNPCGDVSGAITYDYDGEILPADEARSMRGEFGLGNVCHTSYEELVARRETFRTMNLSLRDRDPVCRNCAYNPYCGVSPVTEFARTGDAVPRPHEAPDCKFTLALLDWVFQKMLTEPIPLVRMLGGTGIDAWMLASLSEEEAVGAS
jgi:uncharacterized protein